MILAIGTKLVRYEIRSKLGEGEMGEVRCARDTRLNSEVVIKAEIGIQRTGSGRISTRLALR
jgi:hypothetical protein